MILSSAFKAMHPLFLLPALLPQAITTVNALPTAECPLLGPLYPHTLFDLRETDAFAAAVEAFPSTIAALFESKVLEPVNTSFALDVWSTYDNSSIYSYYHAAELGKDAGVLQGEVGDRTVFRIGSVSKLFNVYAILAAAGGQGLGIFEEKVTKYLPKLMPKEGDERGTLERIKWEEMTIGALAGQQSGVGGPDIWMAHCGCTATSCMTDAETVDGCVEKLLNYMRDDRYPITSTFSNPIYSDGAFIVLGRVLERMTNLSYSDAVRTLIAEPLGLEDTSTLVPERMELDAVALPGDETVSSWNLDSQLNAPSGGVFSSTRDLRKFGLAIMNNAILDPATTRRWMKPMGLVGSLSKAVGAPWEIERLSLPVTASSSRTRVSDLYTKAGGNEGYGANFAISPDHGIGINVLVAGPTWGPDRWTLRDAVGEAFLQAAEWAAFENAKFKFTGTFVSEGHEGSNITVAVDHDHAGLSIEHMFIDGLEWRGNLSYPATEWTPEQLANYSTRLYPMLAEDAPVSGEGGQRVSYRALTYQIPPEDAWQTRAAVDGGQGLFDGWCMSWLAAGFLHSEGQAIDGFVLDFDGDRALVTVEHSLLNLRFVRLE